MKTEESSQHQHLTLGTTFPNYLRLTILFVTVTVLGLILYGRHNSDSISPELLISVRVPSYLDLPPGLYKYRETHAYPSDDGVNRCLLTIVTPTAASNMSAKFQSELIMLPPHFDIPVSNDEAYTSTNTGILEVSVTAEGLKSISIYDPLSTNTITQHQGTR